MALVKTIKCIICGNEKRELVNNYKPKVCFSCRLKKKNLMKYYSQYGQDKYIYENFFNGKKDGFFVEIGASDPVDKSNSLFFEELGWRGILIEPNKEDYNKAVSIRESFVENIALYDRAGKHKFVSLKGYTKMLSGLLKEQHPLHLQRIYQEILYYGGSMEVIELETKTFNDVLSKYNVTDIDYVSIDTEGSELAILNGIDFDKYKIKVFSVENNYEEDKVRKFLEEKGYRFIKRIEIDDIFVNDNI